MLSKTNELKFISPLELLKIYAAEEVYIRSFAVLDLAYYYALQANPNKREFAMPEFWLFIWYKNFSDCVLVRFSLEKDKNQIDNKKFITFVQKSANLGDVPSFEIKFSQRFGREILVIKNGETYDFLGSIASGFTDLFERERRLLLEYNHILGIPVFGDLLFRPLSILKIEQGISVKDFEKYDFQ